MKINILKEKQRYVFIIKNIAKLLTFTLVSRNMFQSISADINRIIFSYVILLIAE